MGFEFFQFMDKIFYRPQRKAGMGALNYHIYDMRQQGLWYTIGAMS